MTSSGGKTVSSDTSEAGQNASMRVMPSRGRRYTRELVLGGLGAALIAGFSYSQMVSTQSDLVTAAQKGNLSGVRSLLSSGGSVSRRALDGKTPLEAAVGAGQGSVVRFLLAQHADPTEGIQAAARTGQPFMLQLLMDKGAKVKGNSLSGLWLCLAAQSGSKECVSLLLSQSADKNTINRPDDAMTPLMYAARSGKAGVVKVLLDHGANVRTLARSGRTPLMFAAAWNEPAACKYLMGAGSNLNSRDLRGQTAVMSAAVVGNAQTLAYLLSCGAALNYKDDAGKTVFDHANESGNPKILAMVRQASSARKTTVSSSAVTHRITLAASRP